MNYNTETQRRISEVLETLGFYDAEYISDQGYFILKSEKVIITDKDSNRFAHQIDRRNYTTLYVNNDQLIYENDNSPALIKFCNNCHKFFFDKKIQKDLEECPLCKSKNIKHLSNNGKIPGWYGHDKDFIIDKEKAQKYLETLEEDIKELLTPVVERLIGTPKYIQITPDKIEKIKALKITYPNMTEVIDYILQSISILSFKLNKQLSFKPILLIGEPGCGKTSFVYELGTILMDKPILKIDLGNRITDFTITGSNPSFKKPQYGIIAGSMFSDSDGQPIKNPIIHFDELDKIGKNDDYNPEKVFYSLLEKDTAKHFFENYLSMNIDASGINYIFTANELDNIPKPIINRLHVFKIPNYSSEQLENNVIDSFYKKWIRNNGLNPVFLPEVLSKEIKHRILIESHNDSRSIVEAIEKIFNETTTIDSESGNTISLFSPKEIYEGWKKYRGHKQISREKWKLPLNFLHMNLNPNFEIEF